MFNPEDFLNLATTWAPQATDERVARTCVGRAYYAAHLSAREKVRRYFPQAFLGKRKGDEHQVVRDKLIELRRADISNKLLKLALKRNRADYNLYNYQSATEQTSEVNKSLLLSGDIISLLRTI